MSKSGESRARYGRRCRQRNRLVAVLIGICVAGTAAVAQTKKGASGLPLPRYVSLKADKVNVRSGPGQDHAISWVFRRAGLPVEITAEYENWRRVRDSADTEGWIFSRLLSGRRTALVLPWEKRRKTVTLFAGPGVNRAVANLEPNVLADIQNCDGKWCKVSVGGLSGWIRQDKLWGVYPQEIVE